MYGNAIASWPRLGEEALLTAFHTDDTKTYTRYTVINYVTVNNAKNSQRFLIFGEEDA